MDANDHDGPSDDRHSDSIDAMTPLLKTVPAESASFLGQKISSLLQDWWLWEILGVATCVSALTIIVVILLIYDSRALPDWPSIFTVGQHHGPFLVNIFTAEYHHRSIPLSHSSPL